MTSQHSSGEEQTPKKYRLKMARLISTFFGLGYFPIAPGTIASFVTVLLWIIPIYLGFSSFHIFVAGIVLFVIGIWSSEIARTSCADQEDPSEIVIDEVAGQTIALALAPISLIPIFMVFFLFRVLDIVKPGPIGWLDRNVKGGLGIMLDDLAAGILVLVVSFFFQYFP